MNEKLLKCMCDIICRSSVSENPYMQSDVSVVPQQFTLPDGRTVCLVGSDK